MKGIERCGECGYYDWEDRCTRGANKDTDPKVPFFANCPLKDVQPVVHGKWVLHHVGAAGRYWECSVCHKNPCVYVIEDAKYCPNCGAIMDEEKSNG